MTILIMAFLLPPECPEDLVDKDIKSISAKIMGIIWPDGKRAHLLEVKFIHGILSIKLVHLAEL
jgi:hypothetical protein